VVSGGIVTTHYSLLTSTTRHQKSLTLRNATEGEDMPRTRT